MTVTNWNSRGLRDLLVGYQNDGKVLYFPNIGSRTNPVFASSNLVQAGGADICLPSPNNCGAPAPCVCDFDHDGLHDLLVGSGSDGNVYYYRNTNTANTPVFAPGIQLKVGATSFGTYLGSRATPYWHDWDEDGLPDLLCGNGNGYVYFFRNIGTLQSPAFAAPVQIYAGGFPLYLDIRAVVRVFDWDGDGLKDLVGSSNSGVYWCRNTNSNAQPILQARVAIQAPRAGGSNLVNINTGPRMRLDLVDWNNDGVIDLLLGNADGTVALYEGYCFGFQPSTMEVDNSLVLHWNSANYLKYTLWCGSDVNSIRELVVSNFSSAGKWTSYTNPPAIGSRYFKVQINP